MIIVLLAITVCQLSYPQPRYGLLRRDQQTQIYLLPCSSLYRGRLGQSSIRAFHGTGRVGRAKGAQVGRGHVALAVEFHQEFLLA